MTYKEIILNGYETPAGAIVQIDSDTISHIVEGYTGTYYTYISLDGNAFTNLTDENNNSIKFQGNTIHTVSGLQKGCYVSFRGFSQTSKGKTLKIRW